MSVVASIGRLPGLIFNHRISHISRIVLSKNKAIYAAQDRERTTALHDAVAQKRSEVVLELLKGGADIDAQDDKGNTPLHLSRWQKEMVQLLLDHKANVDAVNKSGKTTLFCASREGHFEVVKTLVLGGADVNLPDDLGNMPLHRAYSLDVAAYLITKGSKVNAQNKIGKTALHNASKYSERVVPLLLLKGADVDLCGELGITALHRASTGYVAKLLLDFGADPNARSSHGTTPLHFAAQNRISGVVSILIKYGADVNLQDGKGHTILDAASRYRYLEDGESRDPEGSDEAMELTEAGLQGNEPTWSEYKLIDTTIKQQIIRLKAAGLYVSKRNLDAITYSMDESTNKYERRLNPTSHQHELYKYELDCREEVEKLKNHKLNDIVSIYNILHTNKPFYMMDKVIKNSLNTNEIKEYPNYFDIIMNKIKSDYIKIERINLKEFVRRFRPSYISNAEIELNKTC